MEARAIHAAVILRAPWDRWVGWFCMPAGRPAGGRAGLLQLAKEGAACAAARRRVIGCAESAALAASRLVVSRISAAERVRMEVLLSTVQ